MNLEFFNKIGLSYKRENEIKKFVVIFYAVGISGLLIPFTTEFFKIITPLALIVNFVILTAYHKGSYSKKTLVTFISIYSLGFLVEVIGVQTAKIFGSYSYGSTLGFKLLDTPLIIGLNWLFLCYVSNSIFEKYKINSAVKILLASLLMLTYDVVLEQVAPALDFWHWDNNNVPIRNFAAWFFIAFIFNTAIKVLKISTKNAMATLIFTTQFVFFILLCIFKILV